MALCPFATVLLVSANTGGPMAEIRGFAAHSQVGMGSLQTVFDNPARKASTHFWISQHGHLEQYVPTETQAWAHGPGNPYFWSSEFEGMSTDPFTSEQIDMGGQLIAWLHGLAVFPVVINRNGVTGQGLTPHRDLMSTDCPGDLRLGQYPELILATLRHLDQHPTPHHRRDTVHVSKHPSGRIDTLVVGADGQVYHSYGNTVAQATTAKWENLGGQAVSVTGDWSGDQYVVAAHAPDNRLFYKVWNGKAWGGWAPHPNAALLAG